MPERSDMSAARLRQVAFVAGPALALLLATYLKVKGTVHLVEFGELSPFLWKAMSLILAGMPKKGVPITEFGELSPELGMT